MDTRKYGLIAAGFGATISAVNLARGLYIRRTNERFHNYPAHRIVGDSVKRGVIFGGMWPVTTFMGALDFMQSVTLIGLRPSGDMFTPIDVYNMYYHTNTTCQPVCRQVVEQYDNVKDNVQDDNETSETTESTESENTSEPEVVEVVTETESGQTMDTRETQSN